MGTSPSAGIIFGYEMPEDYEDDPYDLESNDIYVTRTGDLEWDDVPYLAGIRIFEAIETCSEMSLESRLKIARGISEEEHQALKELAKELGLEGETPTYLLYARNG